MAIALDLQVARALEALGSAPLVVKLGGEIMLNAAGLDSLARQVAALSHAGARVVVVHGGGPQADALAERLGHTVRKVAGRRVTDDNALEVAKMVYGGSTNLDLLGALRRHGAKPVGLSGVDGGLVTVVRRPPKLVRDANSGTEEWVDFGHVGDVVSVDTMLLDLLFGGGYVPVVASLAGDNEGNIYNVNADTIARALAVALGAARLVLATNVPGVLRDVSDPSSLVTECDPLTARALVESGAISGGMLPKVENCLQALEAGVASVQIVDGTQPEPPLLAALAAEGAGTLINSGRPGG